MNKDFKYNLRNNNRNTALFVLLGFLLPACTQTPEKAVEAVEDPSTAKTILTVQPETEGTPSLDIINEGDYIRSTKDNSWVEFELDVVIAGRYTVEVLGAATEDSAAVWLEDYVGNKDGRTYNITGAMPLDETEKVVKVDGSPLNQGTHKIRLHLNKKDTKVDYISFKLLKPHDVTPVTLSQQMQGEEWTIAWSDEFETDGLPDTSKWTFDIGDWGWGNNELQYYTANRLENARVENGLLHIEARREDLGKGWSSARLTTRGKVAFKYGRIEFRAKVPKEKGNWAAGWTLGDNYVDELSWPYCGEIDILESVGYEIDDNSGDGKAHASIHCGAYYFKLGNQPTAVTEVANMNEAFHTYSVDWSPEGITAAVDGETYFTYEDISNDLAWPFDQPQNIILNLAMGGGWGGQKGMDESVDSQSFIVDYVRVYEKVNVE
ncbi:MAG: family 16 glycosylhydrolase [Bacteroidetes bacterium]|nr:family 16 glycosylhydrolase [Bacteroidota bacterium]